MTASPGETQGCHDLVIRLLEGRQFDFTEPGRPPHAFPPSPPRAVPSGVLVRCTFAGERREARSLFDPSCTLAEASNPRWDVELRWKLRPGVLRHLKAKKAPVKLRFYAQYSGEKHSAPYREVLLGYIMLDLLQGQLNASYSREERWIPLQALQTKAIRTPEVNLLHRVSVSEGIPPQTIDGQQETEAAVHTTGATGREYEGAEYYGLASQVPAHSTAHADRPSTKSVATPVRWETSEPPVPPVPRAPSSPEGDVQLGGGTRRHEILVDVFQCRSLTDLRNLPPPPFHFRIDLYGHRIRTADFSLEDTFPATRLAVGMRGSLSDVRVFFDGAPPLRLELCSAGDVAAVAQLGVRHLTEAVGCTEETGVRGWWALSETPFEDEAPEDGHAPNEGPAVEVGIFLVERSSENDGDGNDPPLKRDTSPPQQAVKETEEQYRAGPGPGDVSVVEDERSFQLVFELLSLEEATFSQDSVVLRYRYSLFGETTVRTHPPAQIEEGSLHHFSNAVCMTRFETKEATLRHMLSADPLWVEGEMGIFSSLRHCMTRACGVCGSGEILGRAMVGMADVLGCASFQTDRGTIQHHEGRVPVVPIDEKDTHIALLRVAITLIEGGIRDKRPTIVGPSAVGRITAVAPSVAPSVAPAPMSHVLAELQKEAMQEVEAWKQEEEARWTARLREKEHTTLSKLEEEWRVRDTERQAAIERRQAEYLRLEHRLRNQLFEVEKREKRLVMAEEDLQRRGETLQHEYEEKVAATQVTYRRMREEFTHHSGLERTRHAELERVNASLRDQLERSEEMRRAAQDAFEHYKREQSTSSETALRAKVHELERRILAFEREMEAAERVKTDLRERLRRTLKDMTHMKRKMDEEERARLGRERLELDALRLQLRARHESHDLIAEKSDVGVLRQELEELRLRRVEELQGEGPSSSPTTRAPNPSPPENETARKSSDHGGVGWGGYAVDWKAVTALEREVARLQTEREELMRTGVYSSGDRVISEIDKRDHVLRQRLRELQS